jgi:DNA repair photolyase
VVVLRAELAHAAGARSIGGVALHLRGEVRQIFMDWLRTQRPDLVDRYEELSRRGAYAPQSERERLSRMVRWQGAVAGLASARGSPRLQPAPRLGAGEQVSRPAWRQDTLF